MKKERRHSSSRFNLSKNRELQKLPALKGKEGGSDLHDKLQFLQAECGGIRVLPKATLPVSS